MALLALLFVALFLFDIGGRTLSSPDEGRYVEIPREMVESGDYVLPRLNGILYFEKPPLFYWLEASAIKVFGISEWSMRLWPALLGLFGCWMTYAFGRHFYGRTAGVVSAGVLATTLLYYALARFIILDMAEAVFMTASLFAFLLSAEEKEERRALWWARAGHAAAALAVLSKGLIGVLLPGLVGLVWVAMLGRWSFVRRAFCPSGILIFLAIATPWHALAATRNQDFLWFYFVHEHLLRFTTDVHRREGPPWYFVGVLAVGFLPWTGYLWNAVKEALPASWARRRERPVELFLILWAGIIFVFFSVSSSKLPPYILPIFPPLALLTGRLLAPRLEAMEKDDLPIGRIFFIGIFALLAIGVPVAYLTPIFAENEDVGPYLGIVAPFVIAMAAIFAALVIAAIVFPRRYGIGATVGSVALAGLLGWTGVSLVASAADPNSVKPVADVINTYRKPGEIVASYGTLFYDLPPYIDDKVLVVDNTGEFVFGMSQEDVSRYLTDSAQFAKMWNGEQRMYMVARTRYFRTWEAEGLARRMCIIKRTNRAVAAANYRVLDAEGRSICDPWYDHEGGSSQGTEGPRS